MGLLRLRREIGNDYVLEISVDGILQLWPSIVGI